MRVSAKTIALFAGPLLAALLGFSLLAAGQNTKICWTAAVTVWVACWWILEPIAIPATSLIPFSLLPLVGVLDTKTIYHAFGNNMIMLLMGGFIISSAMEKSGAHHRLAMGMVQLVGGRGGRRLVLGFLLASTVLSMWISNTATTLMMLPIALAALEESPDRKKLAVPLMLSLAYGANIGGIGTLIGTPTNIVYSGAYKQLTGQEVSFLHWMKLGVPTVVVLTPLVYFWITRNLGQAQKMELPKMGPWRSEEKRVLIVFAITALAWMTRTDPFRTADSVGGWSRLFGIKLADDSTVALLAVVALFLTPNGHGGRLLDWKTAVKIPWGLLLLIGGGMALAEGFQASGLSKLLGEHLSALSRLNVFLMMFFLCLGAGFLTEMMTNTALAVLLMPLLASAGIAAGIDPRLLMVPTVISCSLAFMLPISASPNAVVYGAGHVSVRQMAWEGLPLKFIGAAVVTVLCYFLM